LQGHRRVIRIKRDLDVILQTTMCACILHNLLIDHAIPQDWMVDYNESEEEEEAEDDSGGANHWEQMLAYMMKMR